MEVSIRYVSQIQMCCDKPVPQYTPISTVSYRLQGGYDMAQQVVSRLKRMTWTWTRPVLILHGNVSVTWTQDPVCLL